MSGWLTPADFCAALLSHEGAQPGHGLAVKLVNAGFADAEDLADFFECQTLKIIKSDYKSLSFGKLVDACSEDSSNLFAFDFSAWAGILVNDQLYEVDMIVGVAGPEDVVEGVNISAANSDHKLADFAGGDAHGFGYLVF